MKKSQQYYILILCFTGMLLASLGFSFRGFFVPTYKLEFGIDNTRMGFIIGIAQLASMAFGYLGGRHCLRIGPKRIIALGFLFNGVSIFIVTIAKSWYLLLIAYCGMASSMALLVLGLNTALPAITLFSQAILMNFTHGVFGFGSTLVQKFLGWYLSSGFDWRMLFWVSSGIFFIGSIFALGAPGEPSDDHKEHKTQLIYKKLSFFLMGGLMFYVVAEFLVGSWIINFFQEGYGYTPAKAAFYSTLFYGTFTAGRMLGGFAIHKLNPLKAIITTCLIAATSVFVSQIGNGPMLVFIGLSGLFFAIVYPTTMSLVNEAYGKDSAYFMGISSMVTAMGGFIFNMIFGYFNDIAGVRFTFYLVPICLLLSAIAFLFATHEYKDQIMKKALPKK